MNCSTPGCPRSVVHDEKCAVCIVRTPGFTSKGMKVRDLLPIVGMDRSSLVALAMICVMVVSRLRTLVRYAFRRCGSV